MHCCSQGEGNWYTTVLKEKETVAILLMFQEKGTGALPFSGEGNWRYTAHVSGEGDWCSTVLR